MLSSYKEVSFGGKYHSFHAIVCYGYHPWDLIERVEYILVLYIVRFKRNFSHVFIHICIVVQIKILSRTVKNICTFFSPSLYETKQNEVVYKNITDMLFWKQIRCFTDKIHPDFSLNISLPPML